MLGSLEQNELWSGDMFGINTKMVTDLAKLEAAQDKGALKSFSHAAASIRLSAMASIERSNTPGPAGGPIRSKLNNKGSNRRRLKRKGTGKAKPKNTRPGLAKNRAIFFKADKRGAVIGFSFLRIKAAMSAHEHGIKYKGTKFPKRPTMQPALERRLARFHSEWQGSI